MIYVGIDIAKLNHFASAISSDGEELIKPFKFTNDNDGFHLLISKLDHLDKDSLIIGLESTAHYGDNLVRYLVAKNYKVCVKSNTYPDLLNKSNNVPSSFFDTNCKSIAPPLFAFNSNRQPVPSFNIRIT